MYDGSEMSAATPGYLEIIDFIAGNNPEAVAAFHPSAETQQRLDDLVERQKTEDLSAEEKAELDHFLELEHILRMAKARARLILGPRPLTPVRSDGQRRESESPHGLE